MSNERQHRRPVVIGVRFAEGERATIAKVAADRGETLSEYARRILLAAARAEGRPEFAEAP